MVQPAFHLKVLERYVDVFAEEAAGFVSRMSSNEIQLLVVVGAVRTMLSGTIPASEKDNLEVGKIMTYIETKYLVPFKTKTKTTKVTSWDFVAEEIEW